MKRIPSILSLKTNTPSHIYDLFTDHGKIGAAFSNIYQQSQVTFIDIREHLILEIQQKYSRNELYQFVTLDANECQFEKDSLIIMCGVGGNLIISCLKNYLKNDLLDTQQFVICATMHNLELRKFLRDNSFHLIDIKIADEKGRCYEILLVSRNKVIQEIEIFEIQEWDIGHPIHNRYLKSKIKSLNDKSTREPWEDEVLNKLTTFINGS
jgi:tRNA A22 N-methylase